MILTSKSHYNPCFWTAHWNEAYFEAVRGGAPLRDPREQSVSVLNFRADKVHTTKVEKVHFETNGKFDVPKEQAIQSCRHWLSGQQLQLAEEEITASPAEKYVFSVERLFTFAERSSFYQMLLKVIKNGTIRHAEEKVNLAGAIVLQFLRNPELLKLIGDALTSRGRNIFDLVIALTRFLNDIQHIKTIIPEVAYGEWTFYGTKIDQFPLPDFAVMVEGDSKMIALSPRLLLEIQGNDQRLGAEYSLCNTVPDSKMQEFRRRTIENATKEIIFSSHALLQDWQRTADYEARKSAIASKTCRFDVKYSGEAFDENWLVDLCRTLLFPRA